MISTKRKARGSALLVLSCSLVPLLAFGANAPGTSMEDCKRIESSAELVMQARQAGVPLSKIWKVAEETNDDYLESMYKMLAKNAYDIPQYSTDAMKNRATVDFQNTFFSACIANVEKHRKKQS